MKSGKYSYRSILFIKGLILRRADINRATLIHASSGAGVFTGQLPEQGIWVRSLHRGISEWHKARSTSPAAGNPSTEEWGRQDGAWEAGAMVIPGLQDGP